MTETHSDRDTVTDVSEACAQCGRGNILDRQTWLKDSEILVFPPVLMVVLNRWLNQRHANLDSIDANESVVFLGHRYSLCGTVVHLGNTPNSGHYVAVTKHVQGTEHWWIYNDSVQKPADYDQVSTMQNYYGTPGGNMQSYILLYELAGSS